MQKLLLAILISITTQSQAQKLRLHISIIDSNAINQKTLNYSKEHTNAKSVQQEVIRFRKQLSQLGFLNNKIITSSQKKENYYYSIKLNTQITQLIINISPKQDSIFKNNDIAINNMNSVITIPFTSTTQFIEHLKEILNNNGYTFAQIKLSSITIIDTNAKATLTLKLGERKRIDKITLKGYTDFPKKFIKYNLDLPSKKPLNKEQLIAISQKIKQLPFISELKPAELLFTHKNTNLFLYLKQKKVSSFQGILGINTSENKKTALYGYLKLNLINIFNKGEQLQLDWNKTSSLSQKLYLACTLPYVLKSPISSKIQFSINKMDSLYTNTTSSLLLFRKMEQTEIGIAISNNKSNAIQNSSSLSNYNKNSLTAYYEYSKKSKQSLFRYQAQYLLKIQHSVFTTKDTENIAQLKLQRLFKLNNKNYILASSTSSYTQTNNTSENNTELLGGSNKLSAFNENQFASNNYTIATVAYRYLLNHTIYSSIHFQTAYLKTTSENIQTYSFGTALNSKQKNGLLSLQYNLGKTADSAFKLSNSKITISFLTFF